MDRMNRGNGSDQNSYLKPEDGALGNFSIGAKRSGPRMLFLIALGAAVLWWIGESTRVAAAQPQSKVNPNDGLTYVWIPPSTFLMGCSAEDNDCSADEKPAHSVAITAGFWIGQTPVTQAAYKKVTGTNPSYFQGDDLPVDSISWEEAQDYCGRINLRLPTEAEYEYAARGGTSGARYAALDLIAWYSANSGGTTHDVGQMQANAYGLRDMLGNVWEWVNDWYASYDSANALDPKGPPKGEGRVLRGGSWVDDAPGVRVSDRLRIEPGFHGDDFVGFRCAGN